MSLGFILVAWILGEYVKSESKQEKNFKELERNKRHNYIEEILLNNEACYDLLIENSQKPYIFIIMKSTIC